MHVSRCEQAAQQWTDGHEDADGHEENANTKQFSLGQSTMRAGVRFPIWDFIVEWRKNTHEMLYPARHTDMRTNQGMCIPLPALAVSGSTPDANSMWVRNCKDIHHLPHYLALFIQQENHGNLPHVPAPTEDSDSYMTTLQLHELLLGHVMTVTDDRRSNARMGHLQIFNALLIRSGLDTARSVKIRAQPFAHMTFHSATRTDCVLFRPTWGEESHGIPLDQYDLSREDHEKALGFARVILLFQCRIRPAPGVAPSWHKLAFVEEYWPLPENIWKGGDAANRRLMSSEFGCRSLYAGSPDRIYSVIRVSTILGPASISRDPCHATVPHNSMRAGSRLLHGRADTRSGAANGSELYVLNKWIMTRGSEHATHQALYG